MNKSHDRLKFYIFTTLLTLASAVVFYLLISYAHHSFSNFENWSSNKSLVSSGLMGHIEFEKERQTVAGNKLNLGAWHGYNDVSWNTGLDWDQVTIEVEVNKFSYLWIFIQQNAQKRSGFRISNNPNFLSGYFELDQNSLFVEKQIISLPENLTAQKIKIKKDKNQVQLFINNKLVSNVNKPAATSQLVSFAGSLYGASILKVSAAKGRQLVSESFTPVFNIKIMLISLFTALLISVIFVSMSMLFNSSQKNFTLLSVQFSISITVFCLYLFDYYYWSTRYHYQNLTSFSSLQLSDYLDKLEVVRKSLLFTDNKVKSLNIEKNAAAFFSTRNDNCLLGLCDLQFTDTAGETRFVKFENIKPKRKNQLRIAWLGSSQTWGAGVPELKQSFVNESIRRANKKLKNKIESLNLSKCGVDSSALLLVYFRAVTSWKPDYLIINLSNNDHDKNQFRENLILIIEHSLKNGIRPILSKEATTFEIPAIAQKQRHAILDELAAKYKINVLNFHDYINSNTIFDRGLIWWDMIHLRKGGHELAADFFSTQIIKILKK